MKASAKLRRKLKGKFIKALMVTLSLGEYGLKRADITLSLPFSKWKQTLSGGMSQGFGYRDWETDRKSVV